MPDAAVVADHVPVKRAGRAMLVTVPVTLLKTTSKMRIATNAKIALAIVGPISQRIIG